MRKPLGKRHRSPDVRDQILRALDLETAGKLEEAEQLYRAVIELDPTNFAALDRRAVMCSKRGEHVEALRLIQAAMRSNPRSGETASDMGATAVEKVFTPVAARQGAVLKVTDVAPPVADDPTGQGLFFLLIALSIGSYASVAALGAAGEELPLRIRVLLAVGRSFWHVSMIRPVPRRRTSRKYRLRGNELR